MRLYDRFGRFGRDGKATHAIEGILDKLVVGGGVRQAQLVPVRVGGREDTRLFRTKCGVSTPVSSRSSSSRTVFGARGLETGRSTAPDIPSAVRIRLRRWSWIS